MRASADGYTEIFTYMSICTVDRNTINHYMLKRTLLERARFERAVE